MSMMERITQLAAAPKPKAEKPRVRVMALVGTTPAAPSTTTALPHDRGAHAAGHACPHCTGGQYFNHTKRTWGKCFRCHGKGVLDAQDMAFYLARRDNNRPLCNIYGGPI